jgi:signal transduction histidine kinase
MDVATHRSFFEQLKKTPTVVLAESFERFLAEQGTLDEAEPTEEVKRARQVLRTLAHMKSGICIPLVGQKEILGLWNLHDAPGVESYSTEEIARMMAVGEQAAINIENSMAFEKIREKERMAVLGQMSAGLAHEIRNPLGAIKGAAQYLDPVEVGGDASEFLKIIIEEADRLNQVVDQFLDYARPYQAQMESTDINQVIHQTVRLVAPGLDGKNIQLDLDLHPDLPSVPASGQQLTQVVLNLLTNAVEAMPDGGKLTVKTGLRTDGLGTSLPVALARTGVEVQVTDTGRGIAPEVQQRIFVPFFTTKERGTGLGLAISQRILEHHGGEIRIRSAEGQGSTFTVVLPCPPETPGAAEPADTADEADSLLAKVESDDLPFPPEPSGKNS